MKENKTDNFNQNNGIDKITQLIGESLDLLKHLLAERKTKEESYLTTKLFLSGFVTMVAELYDRDNPGCAPLIYAEVEAIAKAGGLRTITESITKTGAPDYSVSNLSDNDEETAMNYLGKHLSVALLKHVNELPVALRRPDIMMKGIETLLLNVITQKFEKPHDALDNMCERIHYSMDKFLKNIH